MSFVCGGGVGVVLSVGGLPTFYMERLRLSN